MLLISAKWAQWEAEIEGERKVAAASYIICRHTLTRTQGVTRMCDVKE